MKINKIVKSVVICGGVYVLMEMSFLYGKGDVLRIMRKHNLTVDETINGLKEHGSIYARTISNIASSK